MGFAKLAHGTIKTPLLGSWKISLLSKKKNPSIISTSFNPTARKQPIRAFAVMVKAIRVHELGGPEVLKWEDVEIGEPKEEEIRVKNKAIGLNFIDVYFRTGVYKTALPFIPGREAVGVVTAVGPGLTGMKVGDVVAYAGNPMGSYTQEQKGHLGTSRSLVLKWLKTVSNLEPPAPNLNPSFSLLISRWLVVQLLCGPALSLVFFNGSDCKTVNSNH